MTSAGPSGFIRQEGAGWGDQLCCTPEISQGKPATRNVTRFENDGLCYITWANHQDD